MPPARLTTRLTTQPAPTAPPWRAGGLALLAALGTAALRAQPAEPPQLSQVEVRARAENLEGIATAGSEGVVSAGRLAMVPLLRPGEALEMVPGLIVTQHAGDGKANQYFLRGFNLDHGTDFATWVNGVPANMPSHAHGQGYTDLNFLIPELVERVHYRKGPYFAEEGDFSSAGTARLDYVRALDRPLVQLTLGANAYTRTLLAGSPALGNGQLLYGLELFHHNGPWRVPEQYRKVNGVLRYSTGNRFDGMALTAMAYQGRWSSTDQIAQRAIDSGALDRFDSLDPSTGGQTQRYSFSGEWRRRTANGQTRLDAWMLQSGLDLWSNFSYCQNDMANTGSCATGDQFQQSERRRAAGLALAHTRVGQWRGRETALSAGLQARTDLVGPLGLYGSVARTIWNTVREDRVAQRSLALWLQQDVRWTPHWRTVWGLRGDLYAFDVNASLAANAGRARDQIVAPKLSVVYAPAPGTEWYANAGHGFHSNDARGTTIRVDPANPSVPADRVQPLVRTRGMELGLRSQPQPGWQSTLAVWRLDAASELLFVGDAGTTEPSRPSHRHGIEWSNLLRLGRHLALDADLAWSHARFRDASASGDYIPGAVATTANLGVTLEGAGPWSGAVRLRYVGPRPLTEDNSQRSASTLLANLRMGLRLDSVTQLGLDVFNLFNRKADDIAYWYSSQLRGEAAPADDRHVHPAEPRHLRLTLTHRF